MAEEQNDNTKKKFPLKSLLILLGVFALQTAGISGVFFMLQGPDTAAAQDQAALAEAEAFENETIEELVIADKFQNMREGRSYIYDTEIYVQIRRKHQESVLEMLETQRNAIKMDVATVIRRSEPAQLAEPELTTVCRQIHEKLNARFGNDEEGESKIRRVLIPRCIRVKTDM